MARVCLPRNASLPIGDLKNMCFMLGGVGGLTKKAEPPPTRDVNRDSGTASANGGWLRRLVRQTVKSHALAKNLNEYTPQKNVMPAKSKSRNAASRLCMANRAIAPTMKTMKQTT
jgi:hypothetical protein